MGRRPGDFHAGKRPQLWPLPGPTLRGTASIIWIVGGDRPIENETHRLIVRSMAEGLREGDAGEHLVTMHTWGQHSTSEYVHDEPWLDFHTCQSGHARNSANWRFIEADYARTPMRPCMDAEPGYEDMADNIRNLDGGYLDDWDARKALYWALFAGAHGHTYGCNPVWQMWDYGPRPGALGAAALVRGHAPARLRPGAARPRAAALAPLLSRIPDQSLIASEVGEGTHHVARHATAGQLCPGLHPRRQHHWRARDRSGLDAIWPASRSPPGGTTRAPASPAAWACWRSSRA